MTHDEEIKINGLHLWWDDEKRSVSVRNRMWTSRKRSRPPSSSDRTISDVFISSEWMQIFMLYQRVTVFRSMKIPTSAYVSHSYSPSTKPHYLEREVRSHIWNCVQNT